MTESGNKILAAAWVLLASLGYGREMEADLLVVGGNESGVAAAVQAARLGVKRIVLANDIDWLGGQFSAEAVGAIDEWTIYRGKRTHFPRSGMFLEILRRIHEYNGAKYGVARPGNAFCASETIEPAAAAAIFEDLISPYADSGTGQIQVLCPWRPRKVMVENGAVRGVEFENPGENGQKLTVRAHLTLDSTDWGDVIRLSGAAYGAGVDLKSRFNEPSAPEAADGDAANEMNPISYCLVVRESGRESPMPPPPHYHQENFSAIKPKVVFVNNDAADGIYAPANLSIYTHRRLVDRRHNGLAPGAECVLLNWPQQDYPLFNFPGHVAKALEADEPGASKKNIVSMSYTQRQIVFEDAKRQSLGFFHFLQTSMHEQLGDYPESFRRMELTGEFGTPDGLPPKPYVREGLRLEALYMLREQDIRTKNENPRWARVMPPDGVFGFQFNIDFHPTRRKFIANDDPSGPWQFVHTKNRNWSTHTDRAMFPLRGLVPGRMDGLLGCSKNIGVSSIVSSALRLHGQMMHCGQAAGTVAWLCLREGIQPRAVTVNWKQVREVQSVLACGVAGHPGVLLWPFHDLPPEDENFEAINLLMMRGILRADSDDLDFKPWAEVRMEELTATLQRAARSVGLAQDSLPADTAALQRPDAPATWGDLAQVGEGLGLSMSDGLKKQASLRLTRAELARQLWRAIRDLPEKLETGVAYLQPGNDADGDGAPDLEDALPLDRDNDGVMDFLDKSR